MTEVKITFRWAAIKPEYVSYQEFNETLKLIYKKKLKKKKLLLGGKKVAFINSYSLIQNDQRDEIRVCFGYNEFHRYIVKHVFEDDELKAESGITGKDAYDHVNELFQKFENTDLTLYRAFSGTKYKKEYKEIKKCVPKQISYISMYSSKGRIVNNCQKADVSSAFPYQMTKKLPTLHECKRVIGKAEPTEEYPFAFYIKSGHIKIYNELDTRKMKSRFFTLYNDTYDDRIKDDETILCKESEFSLKQEFEYMYSQRSIDVNNKMFMNACIGYFHRNGDPRLSLLAAVCITRNNYEMLKRVEKLEKEGNIIQYIATDCIVWSGKDSDIATNNKYLGSFTYEGHNGKFFGRMVGAYQYIDENNKMTIKCSYLKNGKDKENIAFGKLPEPKHNVLQRDSEGYIISIFGD